MNISRREWMLASMCWSELLAARRAHGAPALRVLSEADAHELRAISNTILPETDTPGAEAAGTVAFIDASLAGYDSDQVHLYRLGLADVAARTQKMFPPAMRFSDLTSAQQIALAQSIEKTEFFDKVRTHTALAYFGNPEFGWKLLGRDPAGHFQPPFGYYDGEGKTQ